MSAFTRLNVAPRWEIRRREVERHQRPIKRQPFRDVHQPENNSGTKNCCRAMTAMRPARIGERLLAEGVAIRLAPGE